MPNSTCLINGFEMDWESIVVNLITNATWALEDKPAVERQIKISLREQGDDWEMEFADSGIGLEAGTAEFISALALPPNATPMENMLERGWVCSSSDHLLKNIPRAESMPSHAAR
jgi:phosphoglycerate-specific signal transduction histidine kinase